MTGGTLHDETPAARPGRTAATPPGGAGGADAGPAARREGGAAARGPFQAAESIAATVAGALLGLALASVLLALAWLFGGGPGDDGRPRTPSAPPPPPVHEPEVRAALRRRIDA
jgi:hypothetical protein